MARKEREYRPFDDDRAPDFSKPGAIVTFAKLENPAGHQLHIDPARRSWDPNRVDYKSGVTEWTFQRQPSGKWYLTSASEYGNRRFIDGPPVPAWVSKHLDYVVRERYPKLWPELRPGARRVRAPGLAAAARRR